MTFELHHVTGTKGHHDRVNSLISLSVQLHVGLEDVRVEEGEELVFQIVTHSLHLFTWPVCIGEERGVDVCR